MVTNISSQSFCMHEDVLSLLIFFKGIKKQIKEEPAPERKDERWNFEVFWNF